MVGKNAVLLHRENKDKKMSYPVGYFECKLDSKGRLLVPADFKEQMGEQVEEGFVLRPAMNSKDHFLELYTRQDWDDMQNELKSKVNRFNPAHLAALRALNDGARFIKLDASGRLQIPRDLVLKGSLNKDVVISSETLKLEIWDRGLYNKAMNAVDNETILKTLQELIQ